MLKPLVAFCFIATMLAGCSSLSPSGLIAAARLDPVETSPSDLSIAVSVPEVLRLHDGDASLYFGFAPDDANIAGPVATTVPLSISNETGPRAPVAGEAIYVFGFSASAAAQLSAVQDQIRSLQAKDIQGTGTLSVGIKGGCLTGALDGSLPTATWLRTSPAESFTALTRTTDILDALPQKERIQLLAQLKPC